MNYWVEGLFSSIGLWNLMNLFQVIALLIHFECTLDQESLIMTSLAVAMSKMKQILWSELATRVGKMGPI